jgi:mono/diheme cytochrome c family protein
MFVFLTLMACSGGAVDTAGDDTAAEDADTDTDVSGGDATNGETLYNASCLGCHGADGKLGVDVSGTPAADLSVRVPADDDARLADQIQNGGTAMPAQYPDAQDAADVIAYLRVTFP